MSRSGLAGASGVVALARHPKLRRATTRAGAPAAKVGWRVGKVLAMRRLRSQLERIGTAGRTAGSLAVIYGPTAAEVLGLVEAPKPRRRTPAFVAGAATGAVAALLIGRQLRSA